MENSGRSLACVMALNWQGAVLGLNRWFRVNSKQTARFRKAPQNTIILRFYSVARLFRSRAVIAKELQLRKTTPPMRKKRHFTRLQGSQGKSGDCRQKFSPMGKRKGRGVQSGGFAFRAGHRGGQTASSLGN
jgi:hypothetical protein